MIYFLLGSGSEFFFIGGRGEGIMDTFPWEEGRGFQGRVTFFFLGGGGVKHSF